MVSSKNVRQASRGTKTMKGYDAIRERGSTPHVIRLVCLRLILEDD